MIVLCSTCDHYWGMGTLPIEPRCAATRVGYVSDHAFDFAPCRKANARGDCEKYVVAKAEEKRRPWWKFWA